MSIDSKTFVVCDKRDMLTIANSAAEAINKWLRAKLDQEVEKSGANSRIQFLNNKDDYNSRNWSNNGCHTFSYDFNSFSIVFGCGDGDNHTAARRSIFLSYTESDYNNLVNGGKLIFSMGSWGSNKEIIDLLSNVLVDYGTTYKIYDDSTDNWLACN